MLEFLTIEVKHVNCLKPIHVHKFLDYAKVSDHEQM